MSTPASQPNYLEVLSLLEDFKTETHPTNNTSLYTGYIDGLENYDVFLSRLKEIGYPFSVRNSDQATSRKIFYSSNFGVINIPFFGSPFLVEKSSIQECVCGKLYFKTNSIVAANEEEYCAKKAQLALAGIKNRRIVSPSKKINCPACLWTRCIRVFLQPDYKTDEQTACTWRKSKSIRKRLNNDLMKTFPPTSTLRFHIALSAFKEHNHDPLPFSKDSKRQKKTRFSKRFLKSEADGHIIEGKVRQLKESRKRKISEDDICLELPDSGSDDEQRTSDKSDNCVIIKIEKRKKLRSAKTSPEVRKSTRIQTQQSPDKQIKSQSSEDSVILDKRKKKVESSTKTEPRYMQEIVPKVNKENTDVVIITRVIQKKKSKPVENTIPRIEENVQIVNIEPVGVELHRGVDDEVWQFHVVDTDCGETISEQVEEMTVDIEQEESQVITNLMQEAAQRIAELTNLCDNTNPVLLEYYSALIGLEDQMKEHCLQYQEENCNV